MSCSRSNLFPYTTLFRSLIENHVAVGNYFVGLVINSYLVGLEPVGADARIDVSFANRDARIPGTRSGFFVRSEEHTSELQSRENLVCRLLLEKKNKRRRL